MGTRTVISLFTGAGGLDFGFEAAGFETRVAVDLDRDACATVRGSRPEWNIQENPVDVVTAKGLRRLSKLGVGDADVVIGGPPCQPFSKAGYWSAGDADRLNDPRAATIKSFVEVIEECLPRVVFFENVPGFAFRGKDEGLRYLERGLEDINRRCGTTYVPSASIVQAASYGVPQMRERFILIADRDGRRFDFPGEDEVPPRTAWDAIGDLPDSKEPELRMRGKWAELLPTIPDGGNYLWHTDRGGGLPIFGWRRRYWSFLLKLAKDRPSWTIQAQPGPATGPFHWDNRRLSRKELARLQTFPDDVKLAGNYAAVHKQVGNAVPSLLAEVLARGIRAQLLGDPLATPLRLLPSDRSPAPAPNAPSPVPARYLTLVGEHSAHPGTGLGYGAVRQGRSPQLVLT